MHGGHPRDERASPGAAPPEWLLHLILVRLLGGAGLASLYLSRRRRTTRQGAVLGSVRRKGHGFPSPHATAAGFGERASLGRSGHFPCQGKRGLHARARSSGVFGARGTGSLRPTRPPRASASGPVSGAPATSPFSPPGNTPRWCSRACARARPRACWPGLPSSTAAPSCTRPPEPTICASSSSPLHLGGPRRDPAGTLLAANGDRRAALGAAGPPAPRHRGRRDPAGGRRGAGQRSSLSAFHPSTPRWLGLRCDPSGHDRRRSGRRLGEPEGGAAPLALPAPPHPAGRWGDRRRHLALRVVAAPP